MDGTNVTVIKQGGLGLPYSLAIDYSARKIYWSDSQLRRIQYCDYWGRNVQTLISSSLIMPISVTIHRYNLYFADAARSNVIKVSKYSAQIQTIFRASVNGLFQLKTYSKEAQPTNLINHPCLRQNGDCSHFCFAIPSIDPQYQISRHCGCPFGFKLDSTNTNCIVNPQENRTSRCDPPYYFRCENNRCIRLNNIIF